MYLRFTHFISGSIKIRMMKPDDVETTNLPIFLLFRKEEEEMTSWRVSLVTFDASRVFCFPCTLQQQQTRGRTGGTSAEYHAHKSLPFCCMVCMQHGRITAGHGGPAPSLPNTEIVGFSPARGMDLSAFRSGLAKGWSSAQGILPCIEIHNFRIMNWNRPTGPIHQGRKPIRLILRLFINMISTA